MVRDYLPYPDIQVDVAPCRQVPSQDLQAFRTIEVANLL